MRRRTRASLPMNSLPKCSRYGEAEAQGEGAKAGSFRCRRPGNEHRETLFAVHVNTFLDDPMRGGWHVNGPAQWFRTATAIIVVACGTAGSAQALPKQCYEFAKWVKHDNDMVIYWAQAANAALAAGAIEEYQYDISKYNFYVYALARDSVGKSDAGC
jgi:hypothetical protein